MALSLTAPPDRPAEAAANLRDDAPRTARVGRATVADGVWILAAMVIFVAFQVVALL
ncbi:MAG: hypothetical protein HOH66_05090 [Rhodospirillaceae bacterium]|jgi:hypothetical protein|nr:hypothetical protein [Rhodospirillaceae bacterium]MBT6117220.1 hypothetical protein [Rhodospirillaceae bacterium]